MYMYFSKIILTQTFPYIITPVLSKLDAIGKRHNIKANCVRLRPFKIEGIRYLTMWQGRTFISPNDRHL